MNNTAKADWLRSEIEKVEGIIENLPNYIHEGLSDQAIYGWNLCRKKTLLALTSIITRYKEELLELDKTNGF